MEEFLTYKEAKNSSHRYLLDLKSCLHPFTKDFWKEHPPQVTARRIDAGLASQKV